MNVSRERSTAELGEDLDEIKAQLSALMAELKAGYVPRELWEARHTALRSEVTAELARLRADMDGKASVSAVAAVQGKADSSHRISWGVLVLLAGVIVTALVGFLSTGAP